MTALRVAIIGTNDSQNISGGRYHALMLAFAVAAAGGEAHLVTDYLPGFFADFDRLAPGGVAVHITADFATGLPTGDFDWVIVIPTGIFRPHFYEACRDFAGWAHARIGLVNFESANWFNVVAPAPRDPRAWDYWRRMCIDGALVLSSTRTSDRWARDFYTAPGCALRFEVWSPPVHVPAAAACDGLAKDGSIVVFVRPQDTHKGASLLTQLKPSLFAGRDVHLISGRDLPDAFRNDIERHLARSRHARVAFHLRIGEDKKFRLLTAAQALLFPSQFEGFGYPPVEAAFAGTESVCFDLPVLRETVGDIAHFAPTPDAAGFEAAMAAALAAPERRAELRQAVHRFADFDTAAWRLADILIRAADRIAPRQARPFAAAIGPFKDDAPRTPAMVNRNDPVAPFPPYVVDAVRAGSGDVLLTVRAMLPPCVRGVQASSEDFISLPVTWTTRPAPPKTHIDTRIFVVAPKAIIGQRITIGMLTGDETPTDPIELEIIRVAPEDTSRPVLAGISEYAEHSDSCRIRGWVLAREPVTEVCFTPDGIGWHRIGVTTDRPDVFGKYPGYDSARCEFSANIAPAKPPDRVLARLLCLAGPDGGHRAIDLLTGWPPAAKSPFSAGPGAARQAAPPQRRAPVPIPGVTTRRTHIANLEFVDRTDAAWQRGVARAGQSGRLGSILVRATPRVAEIEPGMVLRFASGGARVVTRIEPDEACTVIVLNGPLDARQTGFPDTIGVFAADPADAGLNSFVLPGRTDDLFWHGVWNHADSRYRSGFVLDRAEAERLGLAAGTRLRFPSGAIRNITACEPDGHAVRVWLDGDIKPLADGAPRRVAILAGAGGDAVRLEFCLARAGAGWPGGILARSKAGLRPGQAILLDKAASDKVRPGSVLRFGDDLMLRVIATSAHRDGLETTLDGTLDPPVHGHPACAFLVDAADIPCGIVPKCRFADAGLAADDPLHFTLASWARRHGAALRPARPRASAQPRVLLLSLISPAPANQGNRVVTRNLISHLVALGFACDIVVQNVLGAADAAAQFGSHVRIIVVNFPKWQQSTAATTRDAIRQAAERLAAAPLDAQTGNDLLRDAAHFHPYFIVRNETVDIARALFAAHDYRALICNYTHMVRVAEELRAIRPLPPTAIVTHDALSCLPRDIAGQRVDLAYRACVPTLERDVLNAIPGATVVAISASEAAYFRDIGVTNNIVLTEYDAAAEMAPFRIGTENFRHRRIIFHGSANPMNIAALNWFADECWANIRHAVPDAALVVCGQVSATWRPNLPGIELAGELPRDAMMQLCATASLTINPCVAGTGLKIKTVEAACLGLPAVCLPNAVDGLEDVAPHFAIVAQDAPSFTAGCVRLLTDRTFWTDLRKSALRIASDRFSAGQVYRALDDAMQWTDMKMPTQAHAAAPTPIAAEKAEAALAEGEFWQAALHAADLIAQDPACAAGYDLMARGLRGCGLAQDALAAAEQAALVGGRND